MGFGVSYVVDKPTVLPADPAMINDNPINSAFDDLLGLEMTPDAPKTMIQSSETDDAKARKAAKKASKKAKK
jgi:hypothetical protein